MSRLLQHPEVTAQIPLARLEGLLEESEGGSIGFGENGEDIQPDSLVDGFIEQVGGISARAEL